MTGWPARRDRYGSRLLCGRPVPDRGYCGGEIARVESSVALPDGAGGWTERPGGPFALLPWGMIEDPAGSHFWRLSNRAKNQRDRGQKAPGHAARAAKGERRVAQTIPELPWRRLCPKCGVVAEVTAALLE